MNKGMVKSQKRRKGKYSNDMQIRLNRVFKINFHWSMAISTIKLETEGNRDDRGRIGSKLEEVGGYGMG